MTPNHIMPESEKSQRLSKVHSLIQNKTFSDDKLVYSFVLDLRRNDEIDEYIDFVKQLIARDDEYKIFYQLWLVSLLWLRGFCVEAKELFSSLPMSDIPDSIREFYLKKVGFDDLYSDFTIEETEHFVFRIHPKRLENPEDLRHKIERRELGFDLVAKRLFGLSLERKIQYFLWDEDDLKKYFSNSQTCSCHGIIHEGKVSGDWHESTHVYNYLHGLKNPKAFILEGVAVLYDGRKSSARLLFANSAYKHLGIEPDILKWWQDAELFRNTDSWIAYTTAGYFALKIFQKFGKEKFLTLSEYQTFEDACRIYGEDELRELITETENDIKNYVRA